MPNSHTAFRSLRLLFAMLAMAACSETDAPPVLKLSTNAVAFSQVLGTAEPESQTITVTLEDAEGNAGVPEVSVVPRGGGLMPAWLTVDVNATSTASELVMRVTTTGLAPGSYTGAIAITAPGASNAPQEIEVTLTVIGAPVIVLSNNALTFVSSTVDPPAVAQTINVTNGGGSTITGLVAEVLYEQGQPTGWLDATFSGTGAPSVLTIGPNAKAVRLGNNTADVYVSSPSVPGVLKKISVQYNYKTGPTILPTPIGVVWNLTTGTPATAQVVDVNNFGGGQLTGLNATIKYLGNQPPGWLAFAFDRTTAPARLTVQPNTTALPAGSYSAQIEINSPVANGPYAIDVNVHIDTGPKLAVINGGPLTFTWRKTQQGPGNTQGIGIENRGAGTLAGLKAEVSYAPGELKDWLTIYPSLRAQGGSLVVQATGSTLPKGGYTGYITITAPGAIGSPYVVIVSLYVID
ncbi:MAG: hypothetical protein H7Z40_09105 [Phycisphaerae bacterium]|nr:hypothetical protein [Gemmatimonadaceae bacterium]